jgi:hypothetical protein
LCKIMVISFRNDIDGLTVKHQGQNPLLGLKMLCY